MFLIQTFNSVLVYSWVHILFSIISLKNSRSNPRASIFRKIILISKGFQNIGNIKKTLLTYSQRYNRKAIKKKFLYGPSSKTVICKCAANLPFSYNLWQKNFIKNNAMHYICF